MGGTRGTEVWFGVRSWKVAGWARGGDPQRPRRHVLASRAELGLLPDRSRGVAAVAMNAHGRRVFSFAGRRVKRDVGVGEAGCRCAAHLRHAPALPHSPSPVLMILIIIRPTFRMSRALMTLIERQRAWARVTRRLHPVGWTISVFRPLLIGVCKWGREFGKQFSGGDGGAAQRAAGRRCAAGDDKWPREEENEAWRAV